MLEAIAIRLEARPSLIETKKKIEELSNIACY